MRLFRRRRGRHDLGLAVRDIPAAPPVVLVHPPASVDLPPWPVLSTPAPAVIAQGTPPLAEPVPIDCPPAVPAQESGPRVELGFRDGSVAALAPDSAQARALTEIAQVLTRRD